MKTLAKITLFAVGLAVIALPLLNAADTDATTPAPAGKQTHAGRHPRMRALMLRKAVRQRVAQKLNLTDEQKTQLKTTRTNTVAAVKAIRADTSLTPEQKKAKVRETLQTARAGLKNVLTAEQQAKIGKLRRLIRARRQARGAAGV